MLPTLRSVYPFSPFTSFNRLDSLFDRFLTSEAGVQQPAFASSPLPLSLWQDDSSIFLEVELPGVAEKDLDITVHEGVLTVKAEKRDQEGREYLRNGRVFGTFEHAIALPEQVDSEKVEASLTNGVLKIVLPKVAQAQPRKIALKTS